MVTVMVMARNRCYCGDGRAAASAPLSVMRCLATTVGVFALSGATMAQQADSQVAPSAKPAWTIVPRLTVMETLTDRAVVDGSRGGSSGDQITQITPGIRIEGQSAKLKANFDYSLSQIYYAQNTEKNRSQNALNAFGTFEAIDKWFYLDFRGSITQQNVSAFGPLSASNSSVNANSTETSSYSLSPYIRGRFLGFADYLLRYQRTTTETQSSVVRGNDTESMLANLNGDTGFANFSWALDASRLNSEYQNGRKTEADRYYGTLTWRVDPQFRVHVSAGTEANNYLGLEKETRSTHGYGFDWSPTTRTVLSVFRERRFFGDGHRITFSHRTPLTAWKYSDIRDVMVTNQAGTVSLGTFYDLIYELSGSAPNIDPNDPVARAAWTNAVLQLYGLSPTTIIPSDFLSSQASDRRQRQLSFAITGSRNTVTFTAIQTRREALMNQTIVLINDSFQSANVISQRAFNVNWSHRLTADSNLTTALMRMNTSGSSSGADLQTTQKTLTVNFSTRLGPKTTASLGYRRSEFDSATNPYTENALTGTLTARF